jgi:hypothetical protein
MEIPWNRTLEEIEKNSSTERWAQDACLFLRRTGNEKI